MVIYKSINKINGDFYIGKTVNFHRRIYKHKKSMEKGSCFYFHNALRKYGFENFNWEILEECDSKEELNKREIYYINKFNPVYNMTKGGDGGPVRKGKNNGMFKYKGISYEEAWGEKKSIEKKRNISNGLKKLGENHPSKRKDVKKKLKEAQNKKEIKLRKRIKMMSLGDNHPMKRPDIVEKNTESKIKNWKVWTPDGNILFIRNMKEFCKINELQNSSMTLVSQGKRKQHKGYKCIKL